MTPENKNENPEKNPENQENTTSICNEPDLKDFSEDKQDFSQDSKTEQKINKGLNPSDLALTVATISSQFIREEKQGEYVEMYVNTAQPILELINFEELTAGADLTELPPIARAGLAFLAIATPVMGGLFLYGSKKGGNKND